MYDKIALNTKKASEKGFQLKEIDADPLQRFVQIIVDLNNIPEPEFKKKVKQNELEIDKMIVPMMQSDIIKKYLDPVGDPILK